MNNNTNSKIGTTHTVLVEGNLHDGRPEAYLAGEGRRARSTLVQFKSLGKAQIGDRVVVEITGERISRSGKPVLTAKVRDDLTDWTKVQSVRAERAEQDARNKAWQAEQAAKAKLEATVKAAFAQYKLDGGASLPQVTEGEVPAGLQEALKHHFYQSGNEGDVAFTPELKWLKPLIVGAYSLGMLKGSLVSFPDLVDGEIVRRTVDASGASFTISSWEKGSRGFDTHGKRTITIHADGTRSDIFVAESQQQSMDVSAQRIMLADTLKLSEWVGNLVLTGRLTQMVGEQVVTTPLRHCVNGDKLPLVGDIVREWKVQTTRSEYHSAELSADEWRSSPAGYYDVTEVIVYRIVALPGGEVVRMTDWEHRQFSTLVLAGDRDAIERLNAPVRFAGVLAEESVFTVAEREAAAAARKAQRDAEKAAHEALYAWTAVDAEAFMAEGVSADRWNVEFSAEYDGETFRTIRSRAFRQGTGAFEVRADEEGDLFVVGANIVGTRRERGNRQDAFQILATQGVKLVDGLPCLIMAEGSSATLRGLSDQGPAEATFTVVDGEVSSDERRASASPVTASIPAGGNKALAGLASLDLSAFKL